MIADAPPPSRRFWAQTSSKAPGRSTGVDRYVRYGLVAAGTLGCSLVILFVAADTGLLGSGTNSTFAGVGRILVGPLVVGSVLGAAGYAAFKSIPRSRPIVIGVTNGALTVDERPGVAYPLHGATLGTWGMVGGMTKGTALHLGSGERRFVLGGLAHRLDAGTRLDAADVKDAAVDAWVPSSDFDVILEMAGLLRRQDALPSAPQDASPNQPGTPHRCMLYRNPFLYQKEGTTERPPDSAVHGIVQPTRVGDHRRRRRDLGDRPLHRCAHRLGVAIPRDGDSDNV